MIQKSFSNVAAENIGLVLKNVDIDDSSLNMALTMLVCTIFGCY